MRNPFHRRETESPELPGPIHDQENDSGEGPSFSLVDGCCLLLEQWRESWPSRRHSGILKSILAALWPQACPFPARGPCTQVGSPSRSLVSLAPATGPHKSPCYRPASEGRQRAQTERISVSSQYRGYCPSSQNSGPKNQWALLMWAWRLLWDLKRNKGMSSAGFSLQTLESPHRMKAPIYRQMLPGRELGTLAPTNPGTCSCQSRDAGRWGVGSEGVVGVGSRAHVSFHKSKATVLIFDW